jgi:hypothetical protein
MSLIVHTYWRDARLTRRRSLLGMCDTYDGQADQIARGATIGGRADARGAVAESRSNPTST